MAQSLPLLLDGHVKFNPAGDFDGFLRAAPAKWVVYLLSDADDRPVQLLCVKNLRASLKRRLGGNEQIGPSKRVDYRDLIRHVRWRRVDSAFEADWLYYEVARDLFPRTYQGMVGFRPAWFVHVDPESEFPRYVKTTDLTRPGLYIGPVEDKHVAARLIELVEDLFDLCRYYNVLIAAPKGRACAYKEMGKCPAPCDGSVSLPQYRRVIEWSARTLVDSADTLRAHAARMRQAAGELRFEAAAKIKAYVDQLSQLGKGAFRHARWLRDFQFASFQHGPREGTAKVFLITPGGIREVLGVTGVEPARPGEALGAILKAAAEPVISPSLDGPAAERIGIVAHHLFSAKPARGVFLRLDELDEQAILKTLRELRRRPPEEQSEAEGVMKELQSV